MSRQQSFAPDEREEAQRSKKVKPSKPWSVWTKTTYNKAYHLPSFMQVWGNKWVRHKRYETKEKAIEFVERDGRKHTSFLSYEYRITHESEGKPE